jgi:hypothetical protein
MRHVASPVLRRLQDEPLAVPDAARQHLAACERCQAGSSEIAQDAARAESLLTAPDVLTDTDLAWMQLQARLREPHATARPAVSDPWSVPRRLVNASIGTGTAVAAAVLVVGVGAAAALTTVYAPTKVVPVQVSHSDIRAIANLASVGTAQGLGGLPPSGSRQLPFGSLSWTSAGRAQKVSSVAQAVAMTQLSFFAPAVLPRGVGSVTSIMVQPKVTATIHFGAGAGSGVAGSSLVVTGGPALLVQYGGSSAQARMTTLAVAAMQRPVATSTGATASQLESFLLSRPGLPASLAQELRLLGTSSLPVPIPRGVPAEHVQIGGSAGVLVADPSGTAAGVVWESRDGVVRGVAGLLNNKDVLSVARQLG